MIYACTAQNIAMPGSCPVDDLSVCLNDFQALHEGDSFSNKRIYVATFVGLLFENWDRAGELCQAASDGDDDKIERIFNELMYPPDANNTTRRAESIGFDTYSQPTVEDVVVTIPDYKVLMVNDNTAQWLVMAQDQYGGSLDDNKFIKKVIKFNEEYPGAGTGGPGKCATRWRPVHIDIIERCAHDSMPYIRLLFSCSPNFHVLVQFWFLLAKGCSASPPRQSFPRGYCFWSAL
jgi:hypothetical protein